MAVTARDVFPLPESPTSAVTALACEIFEVERVASFASAAAAAASCSGVALVVSARRRASSAEAKAYLDASVGGWPAGAAPRPISSPTVTVAISAVVRTTVSWDVLDRAGGVRTVAVAPGGGGAGGGGGATGGG